MQTQALSEAVIAMALPSEAITAAVEAVKAELTADRKPKRDMKGPPAPIQPWNDCRPAAHHRQVQCTGVPMAMASDIARAPSVSIAGSGT